MATPGPKRSMPHLRIATIFGVPIYLSATWVLFLALVMGLYGPLLHARGNSWLSALLLAGLLALLWGVSVLAHELGHVYVARRMGTVVHKIEIGLLGGLTETETEDERPSEEFWVSVTGPLVSLALAAPGVISALAGNGFGFSAPGNLGMVLATFTLSNLIVGLFNLLPGLPLDGGHILVAIVWRIRGSRHEGVRAAALIGQLMSSLIAVAGIVLLFEPRDRWLEAAVALMVSWSLWDMATRSYGQSRRAEAMEGTTLSHLIRTAATGPMDLSVAAALGRCGPDEPTILLDQTGVPLTYVEAGNLRKVPSAQRAGVRAGSLGVPILPSQILRETTDMLQLASRMRQTPHRRFVMTASDGTVIGVLNAAAAAHK